MLHNRRCTFTNHVELTIAICEPTDFAPWCHIASHNTIVELNAEYSIIGATPTVHVQLDLGLQLSSHAESPAFVEDGCDRRMMADLFSIDWAAIDPALESFA